MKQMIFAAIAALGFVAAPAFADDNGGGYQMGSFWSSGAQGGATNIGSTVGNYGMVGSLTTKQFGAGGEATQYGANAWSNGQVNTVGIAAAGSAGWGPQTAGTSEFGSAFTEGYAVVGGGWAHVPTGGGGGEGGSGCNAGLGNGSEGCDPGNSGNTPAGGVDDD